MKYAKAIVAALGAIITVLTAAFADNVLNMSESATILTTVIEQGITVYGVWKTRNKGYVFYPPIAPTTPPNNPPTLPGMPTQ